METSASCSKTQAVAKAMSQQEKKPEDAKHADDRPQADASLDNPEVRDTIAASREALQKSAEEIERAKRRLLRETEELQPLPGSQPDKKAI
jgi:molecular chaperone GrpE (heat shock protein)